MKVESINRSDIGWKSRITLDASEWPDIGHSDAWLDRPIYRWTMENCWPVSFAYYGVILFGNDEDAIWFRMVWG